MTVYSNPDKYGLKILYECDAGESYTFDKIVLWKDERTGSILMGKDSG